MICLSKRSTTHFMNLLKTALTMIFIKSALNGFEFDLREADSGSYPRGLLYSFDVMDSWLYDAKPGIHLEYEPYLAFLRENENSSY